MLALGIGANTAIFSVVSAVLLRPLPFPEPDRLVLVWENFSAVGGPTRVEVSPGDVVSWRDRNRSFTGVAAFVVDNYSLTGVGDPDRFTGIRTTGNLFTVLGMQPMLGRTLTPGDEQPAAEPVVVIDERMWRSRFAARPGRRRTAHSPERAASYRGGRRARGLSLPQQDGLALGAREVHAHRARASLGLLHVRRGALEAGSEPGAGASGHDGGRHAARSRVSALQRANGRHGRGAARTSHA